MRSMLNGLDVRVTAQALSVLSRFMEQIVKWNDRVHLISRKADVQREVLKQVMDSLALLRLDLGQDSVIMDVGAGVGLPGTPLAAARPDFRVRLIDSSERICTLARRMVHVLGLQNVNIFQMNFPVGMQDATHDVDVFVSKAFRAPQEWLNDMAKLARPGQKVVVMTSSGREMALPAGMVIRQEDEFVLPGTGIYRRNLLVQMV